MRDAAAIVIAHDGKIVEGEENEFMPDWF